MLDQLSYFLLPGESPAPDFEKRYREAYACWQQVWSQTFLELEGAARVFSDDFTRQTRIGALFHRERCVGMGFLRETDFRSPTAQDDSYFKVWSKEALSCLTEDGPRVLVASNLTVHPDFRGDIGGGIHLKNLIVGLVVQSLLASDRDAMTGTMRCNRGAHRSAYQYGASPIQRAVMHHGVEVDLVAFYRRRLSEPGALIQDLAVERLWRNRTEVPTAASAWHESHSKEGKLA